MKMSNLFHSACVLFLGIFLSLQQNPSVNGFPSSPVPAFKPRTLLKHYYDYPPILLKYANEGSESATTALRSSRRSKNRFIQKARRRLLTPLQKATFRVWVFLQQHLFRMMGKERWTRLQCQIRSITEKYTIYVLECEEGKYYVGSTQNKKKRFHQHLVIGRGSVWTRQYKPIRVMKQYKRVPKAYALGLESKVTAETMLEFGINNVRGSMFCNVQNYTLKELDPLTRFIGHYNDLNYAQVREVLREQLPSTSSRKRLRSSSRSNAFTRRELQINGQKAASELPVNHGGQNATFTAFEEPDIEWSTDEFHFARRREGYQSRIKPNDLCYRCGRVGHWAVNCPH